MEENLDPILERISKEDNMKKTGRVVNVNISDKKV